MTSMDLLERIGEAKDQFIMESRRRPKKRSALRRNLPQIIAACLLLCVVGYTVSAGLLFGAGSAEAEPAAAPEAEEPAAGAAPAEEAAADIEAKPVSAYDVTLLDSAQYPEAITDSDQWSANQPADDTYAALRSFSFATASKVLLGGETSGCFSPLSLYQALAILADGAQGQTQTELLRLLGMPDLDTLREQLGKLNRRNYFDDERDRLIISNSLWLDETAPDGTPVGFNQDWVMNAAASYGADVYQAEFSQPDTAQAMGAWVAEKTGGMLHPTLRVNPDMVLSVVNTMWYKSQWVYDFDKEETAPADFTTDSGEVVQADFMHLSTHGSPYRQTEEYTRCTLGLSEGFMVFVLPQEGVDVDDLLTEEKLKETFGEFLEHRGSGSAADAVWSIPKFETTATYLLNNALTDLGLTNTFSSSPDFSGISDTPLSLGFIQQGNHIAINEEGVEAASYTAMNFLTYDPGPFPTIEMNLNRPFIYMIASKDYSPLFIGVVRDPAG